MPDLQTEWEPASFRWVLCQRPGPKSPNETCFCMGPTTPDQVAAGLCSCAYARKYGVLDRRPTLPPVRGPAIRKRHL
jgi:hypothetical protein